MGVPAAGKSTTSDYLVAHHNALRIPEVNVLFDRPEDEPYDWYFERQLDRWDIAVEGNPNHAVTILDGDPYQPVWFDWLYAEGPFAPWDYVLDYFEQRPERALIPDFYAHMVVGDDERKRRMFQREAARGHDIAGVQANIFATLECLNLLVRTSRRWAKRSRDS